MFRSSSFSKRESRIVSTIPSVASLLSPNVFVLSLVFPEFPVSSCSLFLGIERSLLLAGSCSFSLLEAALRPEVLCGLRDDDPSAPSLPPPPEPLEPFLTFSSKFSL